MTQAICFGPSVLKVLEWEVGWVRLNPPGLVQEVLDEKLAADLGLDE
jgi:hypothetical protein